MWQAFSVNLYGEKTGMNWQTFKNRLKVWQDFLCKCFYKINRQSSVVMYEFYFVNFESLMIVSLLHVNLE